MKVIKGHTSLFLSALCQTFSGISMLFKIMMLSVLASNSIPLRRLSKKTSCAAVLELDLFIEVTYWYKLYVCRYNCIYTRSTLSVHSSSVLQNIAGTDIAWARMGQGLVLYSASYREVLDPQPTFSGSDRVNVNKL